MPSGRPAKNLARCALPNCRFDVLQADRPRPALSPIKPHEVLNVKSALLAGLSAEPVERCPLCRGELTPRDPVLGRVCPDCDRWSVTAVPLPDSFRALVGGEVIASGADLAELLSNIEGVFEDDCSADLVVLRNDFVVMILHPDGSRSLPRRSRERKAVAPC
jgi:hypothetical protein